MTMTADRTRFLRLLERRLDLLGALTAVVTDSRNDFIAMDLPAMERRIAEQEQLCSQIRSLDFEISRAQNSCSANVSPLASPGAGPVSRSSNGDQADTNQEVRVVVSRITAAQIELKRANDVHQAMLRRSRRTVQVLLNVFNSLAPIYSAPSVVGSTYEERV